MKVPLIRLFITLGILVLAALILSLNHFYGWFVISTPSFNETYVSLRFDDGLKTQLRAYELLNKYNLTGSIYILTEKSSNPSDWEKDYYMNWSEIENVSSIMEIGGHTRNHADLPKSALEGTLEDEIKGCYDDLVEHGFEPKTFVYPYGNYNKKVVDETKKYFECASTQDVGVNTVPIEPYRLKDFTVRSFSSVDDVKRVLKPGTWIILTFHDIGNVSSNIPDLERKVMENNAVSVELFEETLKYLNETSDIKVVTMAEGCSLFKK